MRSKHRVVVEVTLDDDENPKDVRRYVQGILYRADWSTYDWQPNVLKMEVKCFENVVGKLDYMK